MGFRKGGKGVATAAGCFLVISLPAAGTALLVFILFLCMTSRSSAASLAASAFLPIAVHVAEGGAILTLCALFMAIMIFISHRDNIKRLLNGTEPLI